jgi:hypothetical protein
MASKRELLAIAKFTGWTVDVRKSPNGKNEWTYSLNKEGMSWSVDFGYKSYTEAKRAGFTKLADVVKKLGEHDGI